MNNNYNILAYEISDISYNILIQSDLIQHSSEVRGYCFKIVLEYENKNSQFFFIFHFALLYFFPNEFQVISLGEEIK